MSQTFTDRSSTFKILLGIALLWSVVIFRRPAGVHQDASLTDRLFSNLKPISRPVSSSSRLAATYESIAPKSVAPRPAPVLGVRGRNTVFPTGTDLSGKPSASASAARFNVPTYHSQSGSNGTNTIATLDEILSILNQGPRHYLQYSQIVTRAAQVHGLDPDLIRAVIMVESRFRPNARSPKGAGGLMQLMPGTAKDMGVKDVYDPTQNIMGGSQYLKLMLKTFSGNLRLAVAGYNAGPGAVQKYGGIPPYAETRDYVRKVLTAYQMIKRRYHHARP